MTAARQQPMPAELTREEIREACEAVEWEWNKRKRPVGQETDIGHFDYARQVVATAHGERIAQPRFHPTSRVANEDAHALLEATGEEFRVQRYRKGGKWRYGAAVADGPWRNEDTFRAAATRAVNAWARSKR